MRYDILMKIKSVKQVDEVSLTEAECGDVVIAFECETPLNEWDTCAMMGRYFNDVYFEETDSDSFSRKGDVFVMTGVIRVPLSDKTQSLSESEITIPISSRLTHQLISQEYDAERKESVKERVDNWIGDLFDKQGNLIIDK
ncbi:hypothetical protein R3D73_005163 [Serratia marcescens]|nr:hypothetical protein [Serratia marcescens]ELQ9442254.1 hypothetical protein [Serratia marcescens]ELT5563014.1 hypothetical protein [Serratia marcescens]